MKFSGDHIEYSDVLKRNHKDLLQLKFETINRCNIQCDFCRTDALTGEATDEVSLGIDRFKSFIDQALELGLQIVSFEGKGEPFLDPSFPDYLNYLISKNLFIKIHTNLTFLKVGRNDNSSPFINALKNYKKLSLITTLANSNDFERIKARMDTLKDWNYLEGETTRLAARLLIFDDNRQEIKSYFKYCIQKNIYPRVQLFYNLGRAKKSHKNQLSKNQLKILYDELESIIKENNVEKFTLPTFPSYKAFPLYYTLTIDSSSNVKFYPEFDTSFTENVIGNLNESTLSDIWNKESVAEIRNPVTFNIGKCLDCPQKAEGCYGDKIRSVLMCGGEFKQTDILCWFNESENRNLPQQIIDELDKVLEKEFGKNIIAIGVLNDWEKEFRTEKIKDLKSLFDGGPNYYRLSYVLPTSLEQKVISSGKELSIKAFLSAEKYIFGKEADHFSTQLMQKQVKKNKIILNPIRNWAFEDGKLKKGVVEFEEHLFQDFPLDASEEKPRNAMYVSMLKHKFLANPYGLVFITLPDIYLNYHIKSKLNKKILYYSNYLYEAILKSWYVRLSSKLDEMLISCQKEDIDMLISNYLYCSFFLTNINKESAEECYKEFLGNNYNYFISLDKFLHDFPFSLGDYIYDLIKLRLQALNRREAIEIDKEKTNKLLVSAKKSAIAAVMSRNMSHNFGSHSLVYLGNKKNITESFSVFNKEQQLIISEQFNKKVNLYNL